jgi:3-hydroxyisobutyrate dehydrogenase/2-hydroxy-3-oxopropionate reductase
MATVVTSAGSPVAVVGTGRMGAAMATRLCRAGHAVVVFNRSRPRAQALASSLASDGGVTVAGTAREAAAGADLVISSLADDAAVESTYAGPDGLAAGLRAGAVVLETSTVAPATVRAVAPLVERASAVLLDAPVSGSVPIVERGELTFMVGGDASAIERARPILDVLGARVFHLGELGTGATMKLAVNAVVHALNQAIAEALVLAERAGVDRQVAYEVFAASAIAAPFVHYKKEAYLHPGETPVAFMLDLVAKDLALIADLADTVDARMEQSATNRKIVLEALDAGLGGHDLSALAILLRGDATTT